MTAVQTFYVNASVTGSLILRVDGDVDRESGKFPEIDLGKVTLPIELSVAMGRQQFQNQEVVS